MEYFNLVVYVLFTCLKVHQSIASIPLDQIGHCKSQLYDARIRNFNLNKLGGEQTNVYVSSNYHPLVVCSKELFIPKQHETSFMLLSTFGVQSTRGTSSFTELSEVEPESDGTFTITEYTTNNGTVLPQYHTLIALYSGVSGGVILYICNSYGTSTKDLRILAVPSRGYEYYLYGVSNMLQKDINLKFSGTLRRLKRCY